MKAGWESVSKHVEKTDMLMDLAAESGGFPLGNFTSTVRFYFNFMLKWVSYLKRQCFSSFKGGFV